jgi:hypothetical protein
MRRHLKTKFDQTRAADDSRDGRDFHVNDRSASLQWCDLERQDELLAFRPYDERCRGRDEGVEL